MQNQQQARRGGLEGTSCSPGSSNKALVREGGGSTALLKQQQQQYHGNRGTAAGHREGGRDLDWDSLGMRRNTPPSHQHQRQQQQQQHRQQPQPQQHRQQQQLPTRSQQQQRCVTPPPSRNDKAYTNVDQAPRKGGRDESANGCTTLQDRNSKIVNWQCDASSAAAQPPPPPPPPPFFPPPAAAAGKDVSSPIASNLMASGGPPAATAAAAYATPPPLPSTSSPPSGKMIDGNNNNTPLLNLASSSSQGYSQQQQQPYGAFIEGGGSGGASASQQRQLQRYQAQQKYIQQQQQFGGAAAGDEQHATAGQQQQQLYHHSLPARPGGGGLMYYHSISGSRAGSSMPQHHPHAQPGLLNTYQQQPYYPGAAALTAGAGTPINYQDGGRVPTAGGGNSSQQQQRVGGRNTPSASMGIPLSGHTVPPPPVDEALNWRRRRNLTGGPGGLLAASPVAEYEYALSSLSQSPGGGTPAGGDGLIATDPQQQLQHQRMPSAAAVSAVPTHNVAADTAAVAGDPVEPRRNSCGSWSAPAATRVENYQINSSAACTVSQRHLTTGVGGTPIAAAQDSEGTAGSGGAAGAGGKTAAGAYQRTFGDGSAMNSNNSSNVAVGGVGAGHHQGNHYGEDSPLPLALSQQQEVESGEKISSQVLLQQQQIGGDGVAGLTSGKPIGLLHQQVPQINSLQQLQQQGNKGVHRRRGGGAGGGGGRMGDGNNKSLLNSGHDVSSERGEAHAGNVNSSSSPVEGIGGIAGEGGFSQLVSPAAVTALMDNTSCGQVSVGSPAEGALKKANAAEDGAAVTAITSGGGRDIAAGGGSGAGKYANSRLGAGRGLISNLASDLSKGTAPGGGGVLSSTSRKNTSSSDSLSAGGASSSLSKGNAVPATAGGARRPVSGRGLEALSQLTSSSAAVHGNRSSSRGTVTTGAGGGETEKTGGGEDAWDDDDDGFGGGVSMVDIESIRSRRAQLTSAALLKKTSLAAPVSSDSSGNRGRDADHRETGEKTLEKNAEETKTTEKRGDDLTEQGTYASSIRTPDGVPTAHAEKRPDNFTEQVQDVASNKEGEAIGAEKSISFPVTDSSTSCLDSPRGAAEVTASDGGAAATGVSAQHSVPSNQGEGDDHAKSAVEAARSAAPAVPQDVKSSGGASLVAETAAETGSDKPVNDPAPVATAKNEDNTATTPAAAGEESPSASAEGGPSTAAPAGGGSSVFSAAAASPPAGAAAAALLPRLGAGAWRPRSQRQFSRTEEVDRGVKSLLNKLTVEKFATIAEKLATLLESLKEEKELQIFVNVVMEKAVTEPDWSEMYADLCQVLQWRSVKIGDGAETENFRKTPFMKALLTRIQEEYEAMPRTLKAKTVTTGGTGSAAQNEAEIQEELQQLKRTKNRILGVVKLIGELFQRKILGFPIVRDVVIDLVIKTEEPDEHFIECFVQLIATTGYYIDQNPKVKVVLDSWFGRLTELQKKNCYTKRLKWIIQDTLDMRKAGWRKKIHKERAKALSDLREQLQKEEDIGGAVHAAQYGNIVVVGQRSNLNGAYAGYLEEQQHIFESKIMKLKPAAAGSPGAGTGVAASGCGATAHRRGC